MKKEYDQIVSFRVSKIAKQVIIEYMENYPQIRNRSRAINAIIETYRPMEKCLMEILKKEKESHR